MSEPRTFLGSLFDLSFQSFVTLRLVRFLYVVALVALAFATLSLMAAGLTQSDSTLEIAGLLVLAPVGALLYLIFIRIFLELVVVVFRIGESMGEVRDLLRERPGT